MSQTTTVQPEPTLAQRVTDWARPITAYMVLGSFAVAFFLAYRHGDASTISALVNTLQNLLILIVGYYFGSSSGSQKKDDVIGAIATGSSPSPTPTTGTHTP